MSERMKRYGNGWIRVCFVMGKEDITYPSGFGYPVARREIETVSLFLLDGRVCFFVGEYLEYPDA